MKVFLSRRSKNVKTTFWRRYQSPFVTGDGICHHSLRFGSVFSNRNHVGMQRSDHNMSRRFGVCYNEKEVGQLGAYPTPFQGPVVKSTPGVPDEEKRFL